MKCFERLHNRSGVTVLEILIVLLISGVLTIAAFNFFTEVGHQAEVQYDVSEMQQLCRISMEDIRKTLRSAGYMVAGPAYEIKGDSLAVYYSETQPVDTTLYFLQAYSDTTLAKIAGWVAGNSIYYLMKQTNSAPAVPYADFITDMTFTQLDSANILVAITTQVPRGDDRYATNNGFRKFTITERINVRNAN